MAITVVLECATFAALSGLVSSSHACSRKWKLCLRRQTSPNWSLERSRKGCLQPKAVAAAAAAAVSTVPDSWVASEEATNMAAGAEAMAIARAALLAARGAEAVSLARAALLAAREASSFSGQVMECPESIEPSIDDGRGELHITEEATSSLERLISVVDAEDGGGLDSRETANVVVSSKRRKQRKDLRATAMEKKKQRQERAKEDARGLVQRGRQAADKDRFFPQIVRRGRLSAAEEIQAVRGIQDLFKMEVAKTELREQLGRDPTFKEWGEALKLEPTELERKLHDVRRCKNMVISSNMGLVIKVARRFATLKGTNTEDLIQEGIDGLLKGVDKFDTSRGFRLSTYVLWWIELAVRRAAVKRSVLCQVPMHLFDMHTKITKTRLQIFQERGSFPTDEELAKLLGTSPARVTMAANLMKPTKSLHEVIPGCDKLTHMDVLADTDSEPPFVEAERKLLKKQMEQVLSKLSPRERRVLRLRHGLEDGRVRTLEELGHMFDLSRERIRQIEKKALWRISETGGKEVLASFAATFGGAAAADS